MIPVFFLGFPDFFRFFVGFSFFGGDWLVYKINTNLIILNIIEIFVLYAGSSDIYFYIINNTKISSPKDNIEKNKTLIEIKRNFN